MERIFACRVDELEPGSTMTVDGPVPVALYRTEDGDWFASDDSCTHEQFSLGTESDLEDDEVVCPLHMARFDLRTGKALCFPATIALRMHEVVVEGEEVHVVLSETVADGPGVEVAEGSAADCAVA
ncbi:non-heme iron oxygenase ferredoxin subunit [Janibacter terrae]|uniref:non-heme iron oxygenase ferredoxin subunit n=1 Tax=Janibacter terrae TaxID=103817 RepID=UPI0009ECDD17|nr:non-heme iron oxygenase ferredoxin subunit [Janibacter terrae]HBO54262.1 non-heme iron oxygenase ferredoxin subunit [Janibacter terrae]